MASEVTAPRGTPALPWSTVFSLLQVHTAVLAVFGQVALAWALDPESSCSEIGAALAAGSGQVCALQRESSDEDAAGDDRLGGQSVAGDDHPDSRGEHGSARLSASAPACALKDRDSAESADPDQDEEDGSDDDSPDPGAPPVLGFGLDYYRDSQHYVTVTATSAASVSIHNFSLDLRNYTVDARDSSGREGSQATVLSVGSDLSELLEMGGGVGAVRTSRGSNDLVGSFRTRANLWDGTIAASVSRDLLAITARTIRNHVRQTDFGIGASDDLTRNFSADFEFHHKSYTDRNGSNELEFSPEYAFDLQESRLRFGYRFTYQNFARHSHDGYFDPRQFLSHEAFAAWTFDWVDYYGRLELSLARQSYRDSGSLSRGLGGAAVAALGLRPSRDLLIELYGSAGNYASGASSGWNYAATGFRLNYTQ